MSRENLTTPNNKNASKQLCRRFILARQAPVSAAVSV
jgi:hypothetical protein